MQFPKRTITTATRPQEPGLTPTEGGLAMHRLVLAHLAIFFILFGSVACIIVDGEIWPFSNYPMFSRTYSDRFAAFMVYGITIDGEVPLTARQASRRYWSPLDGSRINGGFSRMAHFKDAEQRFASAAKFLVGRYRSLQEQGRHDGPQIHGIRIYYCTWTLKPWAINRDTPDSKHFIAEAMVERMGGS